MNEFKQSPAFRYQEDQRVVRRLRAWLYREYDITTCSEHRVRLIREDLTAFLRDEKARIGGRK